MVLPLLTQHQIDLGTLLSFNDENYRFEVIDDEGIARSMTKSEAEEAFRIVKEEMPEEEHSKISKQLESMRDCITSLPDEAPQKPTPPNSFPDSGEMNLSEYEPDPELIKLFSKKFDI